MGGHPSWLPGRMVALCSLPRTDQRKLFQFVHADYPFAGIIADKAIYWRDYDPPGMDSLFPSEIHLSLPFLDSNVRQLIPMDHNCMHAWRRFNLGLDLYRWLTCRTFLLTQPLALTWEQLYVQNDSLPEKGGDKVTVEAFRKKCLWELMKINRAWSELNAAAGRGRLILHPTPAQILRSRSGRLLLSVRHSPPLPCPASLLVTAGAPAFPYRVTVPSFTRAYGCLQPLAWRLIRWAGASLLPEHFRSPNGASVIALPMPSCRDPALGAASSSPLSGLAVAASPG